VSNFDGAPDLTEMDALHRVICKAGDDGSISRTLYPDGQPIKEVLQWILFCLPSAGRQAGFCWRCQLFVGVIPVGTFRVPQLLTPYAAVGAHFPLREDAPAGCAGCNGADCAATKEPEMTDHKQRRCDGHRDGRATAGTGIEEAEHPAPAAGGFWTLYLNDSLGTSAIVWA